eukprot:5530092-Prymnesium_polylepis.1
MVDGGWLYGLFARVEINSGEVICRYQGKATVKNGVRNRFSMCGTSVADGVQKLMIDGTPRHGCPNLGGLAAHSYQPNAAFVDDFLFRRSVRRAVHTNVMLVAGTDICCGAEIRVDHDSCEGRSAEVDGASAWSASYRAIRWQLPAGTDGSDALWDTLVAHYWRL